MNRSRKKSPISRMWSIKKQLWRFRGKGESDLNKISSQIKTLEDWIKRSQTIRDGILIGGNLSPLPRKTLLNPVFHSLRHYDEYQVENVYFESIPGFYVTGTLYRPIHPPIPTPVVLKPHGHWKNKRYSPENQYLCATLARMGCIVFTYDMIGYADSTQVKHKIKSAFTLQTWNSIRSLDFLISLPNIDKTRVGITGESGGGTQTFILTAIDDRITVSAPLIMVSSFFFGGCICESGLPIHAGEGYKTNNAEITALSAPRASLIVSDGGDWTRFVPTLEFPFIQSIYRLFDRENLVENAHFPKEGHNLSFNKRSAVYNFFARHFYLNLEKVCDANGKIDESSNNIEDEDKLHVFDAKHPRPTNAIFSEKQINSQFTSLQFNEEKK